MKWEYKTVLFNKKKFVSGSLDKKLLDKELNSYGDNGWELVSFELKTTLIGQDIAAFALFKRAKS